MKVVQINGLDTKGGAAKVSYTLHKEYLKRGMDSSLLVGQKLSVEDRISEIKGRPTNRFVDRYSRILKVKDLLPISNPDLFEKKDYTNAEIVHLHNLHGGYFNLKNLKKITSHKPVIWTLHDMWAFTPNSPHTYECTRWIDGKCNCGKHRNILFKTFESYLLNRKSKIYNSSKFVCVVPSKWMKDNASKSILKDKRIEVIENGVDETIFTLKDKKKIREKLNLPMDKKILCFVAHGGLDNQWKGGNYLLEAWKELRKSGDVVLLEIGVNGNEIIAEDDHIKIPYVNDPNIVADYYSASDLFLFTSLGESSSLVAIEALLCGLPVVSFDVGPLKEIVKDGVNGLLSRYKDVQDFVSKVERVLNDSDLYNKFVSNARDSVIDKYTLDIQVEKYIKLYNEIIEKYEV